MLHPIADKLLNSPALVIFILLLTLAVWFYSAFGPRLRQLDVPAIIGKEGPNGVDFCSAIEEGTAKYPNSIFKLKTSNYETVILPHQYIEEIKSAPEETISLGMELYERQLGQYTLIGTVGRAHGFVNSVRTDLNRNLSATFDTLQSETQYAASASIGTCTDWKPIHIHPLALRLVAMLSGRVFVGPDLCRNEDWIQASIQTTVDTFSGAFKLWSYHWTLRPIMALMISEIRNVHKQHRRTARLLKPVLDERLEMLKNPDFKPPTDMLQFFLNNLEGRDASYQAALQSAINVAAIHTTSMNVTHALYDLAAYPDHVQPLRHEAAAALEENGGVWDKNSIVKLRKMDSFLRESQRMSPPGVVSMSRYVQKDITFSDGITLPKGCLTACDSWSATRDRSLWENPEVFDGFRFEKLRSIPGNEARYQFVTSSPNNMPFGHGAHSCPGRFFVANEVKILLSHLILNYDIALRPGQARPQSSYFNIMILPNMQAELLFRSRVKS